MKVMKKFTATILTTIFVLSGTSTVFAEDTYQNIEKEKITSFFSAIAESLDADAEDVDQAKKGSRAQLILDVEPAGQTMVSLLAQMDLSWLDNIALDMDISAEDAIEAIGTELLLNGSHLLDFNVFADSLGMKQYIQIPELSDSYLFYPVLAEDGNAGITPDQITAYLDSLSLETLKDFDITLIGDVLSRYLEIVVNHVKEEVSISDIVSVAGIEEECTLYEARLYENDAYAMVKEILTTAKNDEDLKTIIDLAAAADPELGDLYAEFQNEIEYLLEDFEDEAELEFGSEYFSSQLWINADGDVVARELALMDDMEIEAAFRWMSPESDDASALLAEITDGYTAFTITGISNEVNGIKSGEYAFSMDYVPYVNVVMNSYDVAAAEAGSFNASYTISLSEAMMEDEEMANMLGMFDLQVDIAANDESAASSIALTLNSAGAPLASLTLNAGYGDGMDIPDLSSITEIYNLDNEEHLEAYVSGISFSELMANAKAAGLPDELLEIAQYYIDDFYSNMETSDSAA